MIHDVLDRPVSRPDPDARAPRTSGAPLALRIDGALPTADVLESAAAIAHALRRDLLLVRALGTLPDGSACTDPVDWDIGRARLLGELRRIARRLQRADGTVDARVVDRFVPAEFAPDAGTQPMMIGFVREPGELPWHRDADARVLVDNGASVLIVPACRSGERRAYPSRLLVPLDGSTRAERAIEQALQIIDHALTKGQGARLVLAHVAPEPVLTRVGPPDGQDDVMAAELLDRNRRVATDYLHGIKLRHSDASIPIESRLLDGNVPRGLLRTIANDRIDMIVMASDGAGAHGDVTPGSVATHLAAHATVPLLLIGSGEANASGAGAEVSIDAPLDRLHGTTPPTRHG